MDLESAVQAWKQLLGDDRAIREATVLDKYARTTEASSPRALAVLRPKSRDEVVEIVKIANRTKVPIYPISRGKNWGMGSACPVTDGQVIVDLSLMNRIIEVHPLLGYAVVEPGVSQGELSDYIRDNKLPYQMDCTASARESSIVGNCVERGDGWTPHGDRFAVTCGYEVVLPTGEVMQTGFGQAPGSPLVYLHKWGVGPSLDGLFSQSNLGIVTRMGFWLLPKPEAQLAYFIPIADLSVLEKVIDRLRPLRMDGTIQMPLHILNDYKTLQSAGRYPWDESKGATPLPQALLEKRLKGLFMAKPPGSWYGAGGIQGTKDQVRAHKKAIMKALAGVTRPNFVSSSLLNFALSLARFLKKLGLRVGTTMEAVFTAAQVPLSLLSGTPSNEPLLATQWRLRHTPDPKNKDPLENNVGMYWLAPMVPMIGSEVRRFAEELTERLLHYGFEPGLNITFMTGRATLLTIAFCYDRTNPEEMKQARVCFDALFDLLMKSGRLPFRMGIEGMDWLDPNHSPYWKLVRRLKEALDPAGILAPGRYEPWHFSQGRQTIEAEARSDDKRATP